MKKRDSENMKNKSKILKIIAALLVMIIIFVLLFIGFRKKEYSVTFDSNGGSTMAPLQIKKDSTIKEPKVPVRDGYVFAGWYYNNKLFDFSRPITKNMKLEARWVKDGDIIDIELEQKNLKLKIGDTYKLNITIKPSNATNKELVWSSSDVSIATVDNNGNVKALREGTATITVKTKDGKHKDKVKITVNKKDDNEKNVSVASVSINKTNVSLNVGEKIKLIATIKPSNATNKELVWSSSDVSIATVDNNGNVKALREGTATITVKTKDGKHKATVKIKVNPKEIHNSNVNVSGVLLDKTNVALTEGENTKLTATIKPNNATNKELVWSSSDASVATVDNNGNVKALREGTATITVKTKDGGYTASCVITVKEKQAKYVVIYTPIVQEGTGAILQYSVAVTKDEISFSEYSFIIYNNKKVGTTLSTVQYNNNVTTATIRLSNGSDVTATVVYK